MSSSLPIGPAARIAGPYTASAGQTNFSFSFALIDRGDLRVETAPAADPENWTAATLDLDYTMTPAPPVSAGGTVVFGTGRTAGTRVRILGLAVVANTQDPVPGGKMDSGLLNRFFDRVTIWGQEARRDIDHAVDRLDHGSLGWTALEAMANYGDRRVRKIVDWVGGLGTKPDINRYVGPSGLVADIAQAVDIRGKPGVGIALSGVLDAVEDLPASGSSGDAWLIGTYLYVWSATFSEWQNAGSYMSAATDTANHVGFTTVDLADRDIPVVVQSLRTAGYAEEGDFGGGQWKRAASEPAHAAKRQSADGAWWELAEQKPSPLHLGADPLGIMLATAAVAACIALAVARGGGAVDIPPGSFKTNANLPIASNVSLIGDGPNVSRIVGSGDHDGLTVAGEHVIVEGLRVSGMRVGIAGAATARFCRVFNCFTTQNRIGIDWLDGYINSVHSTKVMFNSYGVVLRGLSFQFNLYDNVIDNNTGGCGVLCTGSIGANIYFNTIEGNRVLATRQGVGLAVFGNPQRLNVFANWLEQNGLISLGDGSPNPYAVDILIGDGTSTVGAEIVNTCLPEEYKPTGDALLSAYGHITIGDNFFVDSKYAIVTRLQGNPLNLTIRNNRFGVKGSQQNVPVLITWISGSQPDAIVIDGNVPLTVTGSTTWTAAGIGGSYVYCNGLPPPDVIKLDGVDLFTRQMTTAEFAALAGATLAVDARPPIGGGPASLYRDVKARGGVSGVRTEVMGGRCLIGAADPFTIGQDTYAVFLSSPGGQFSHTYGVSLTSVVSTAVAGKPDTFHVTHLNTPTATGGTFYASGDYFGYALMTAATYAAAFAGRTRLRITDLDVVRVRDMAAAPPSSAQQASATGDVVWNTAPANAGEPAAWVAAPGGTPGTWRPLNLS